MSLEDLIQQARVLKLELQAIEDIQRSIIEQQTLITGRLTTMASMADDLKALITDIGNDVTEIDGDLDEVIAKVNELSNAPSQAELDEIKTMLGNLKQRTRSAADKVPEPTP